MRSLTPTLLAAQRVSPQRPRVQVLVRDKQARVSLLGKVSSGDDVQASACLVGAGVAVLVATLDNAGRIRTRLVGSPESLSDWGAYTGGFTEVVAAGGALAWPLGDVVVSRKGSNTWLFYVKADGTEILSLLSANDGITWGSPATVRAVAGGDPTCRYFLASGGNDDCWYTVDHAGYRFLYAGIYSGGSWGSWQFVSDFMWSTGEYAHCYGLSVVYDSSTSLYCVAAGLDRNGLGDGWLVTFHWNHGTAAVTDYQSVAPPGWPMAGSCPWQPCLFRTSATLGSRWILTYWDTFTSGTASWTLPVMMMSRDFGHWSYKVPLDFTSRPNLKRLSIVEKGSVVYLHQIHEVSRVDLWYSGKSSAELTVAQGKILRYRINERPEAGELHVELDNRGGTYDSHTALQPLAGITIKQGLNTSAGDELVECRPLYLWSHSQVRDFNVNLVRLYAVDGWQLLRMWRPDCTISWENKTLGWCIGEVACRAGNFEVTDDGNSAWDEVLTYLTVAASYDESGPHWWVKAVARTITIDNELVVFSENMSGLSIIHHLLGLVGGMARWGNGDSREVLHLFIPSSSDAVVHDYTDGEILRGQYVTGFAWPSRVRATSPAGGYEAQSVGSGQACGMDVQLAADGALHDGAARAQGGWMVARPNAGLELYDVVEFSDGKAGAGVTDAERRVNALLTEFDPLRRVWQQTIYMEAK